MNKIITITRQFGSGGREIGKKLAEAYGIPFYDNGIFQSSWGKNVAVGLQIV